MRTRGNSCLSMSSPHFSQWPVTDFCEIVSRSFTKHLCQTSRLKSTQSFLPFSASSSGTCILYLLTMRTTSRYYYIKLTTGNHPTSSPPPMPLLLRISTSMFPIRAQTGYPISFPNDESFVLSAQRMRHIGFPPWGRPDCH